MNKCLVCNEVIVEGHLPSEWFDYCNDCGMILDRKPILCKLVEQLRGRK